MLMATKPSVRESSWYLWTRISRRALTCLERMEEVGPEPAGDFRRLDGRHDRLAVRGDGHAGQSGVRDLRRGLEHLSRRDRQHRTRAPTTRK